MPQKKQDWIRAPWFGVLLVALLLMAPRPVVHAQSADTYTLLLRDVPLDQALRELADATRTNLMYDTHLVRGKRIFCAAREVPPEQLLRCILSETDLDFYRTSDGTYVLTEALKEVPRSGHLAGMVVDEATGEPLPYATVMLADAGVGTAANDAGLFSFSSLTPGPYRVVVTYVGYNTAVDSIWIGPGSSVQEQIGLEAKSIITEPIIVSGLQQRLPSQRLGKETLNARELVDGMNSLGAADVARGTGSIMGVSLQEPAANLHLQGGGAGEMQMQLDGMPIRSPVTLGQLLGAFSPLALGRLTVHKAGFDAARGSHLAGTVAAEHALGEPERHFVTAQVDPLSFNVRGRQQWTGAGGRQASAMVAARTGLWAAYQNPTLSQLLQDWHVIDPLLTSGLPGNELSGAPLRQHHADVGFSDLHGAARVRLDPFHTIRASLYRGHSHVESEAISGPADPLVADESGTLRTRDSYDWTNWSGQVRYEGLLTERLLATLSFYRSVQKLGHGYRMNDSHVASRYPPSGGGPYDGNWLGETTIRAGADYNLATRHHLSGSLEATRTASRALIDNDFFLPLSYSVARWRFAGHLQDDVSIGMQTNLEGGLRLTFIPDRQTVYAEPRVALRYDGHHDLVGDYALRLASGIYRQFVNQFDVGSTGPTAILPSLRFWLPVDASLAPPRSYHLAADAMLRPADAWQVNLETYYKWQPRLLEVNYPALLGTAPEPSLQPSQAAFISPTNGRAYGSDVRVRYTREAFEGALTYSYSRSLRVFPGRFEEQLQPTPWEQPHRLTVESSVGFGPAVSAHLNWRSVWGRSWAFRRAYYDFLASTAPTNGFAPFNLNNPAAHVLSPLHQLDLGLTYDRDVGGLPIEIRTELINALDRKNAFDWNLRPATDGYEQLSRVLPGRRFALSVRVSY